MAVKGGLKKGLDLLFEENAAEGDAPVQVRLSRIEPNPNQPRKHFDEEALQELADSIAKMGLLQPLVVRQTAGDGYLLVAGERRWRAARLAGLTEVPVIVRELSDREADEIALVENLQREDLNPMEEAAGFKKLMDDYGMTQEQVAERMGRSRSAVANAVRLLSLPGEIADLVAAGKISAGHGRALLAIAEPDQREAALQAALKGATVRQMEQLARSAAQKQPAKKPGAAPAADPYYTEVELALQEALGRRVRVRTAGKKGTLEIEFYNREDLQNIAAKLGD